MKKFILSDEPEDFDEKVRQKGNQWLRKNPDKLPKDYWSISNSDLAKRFDDLCSYAVMRIPSGNGTVDHYLSKKNYPHLAYEWSNYRHAFSRINGCKQNYDTRILDPFEVDEDWFEIILPSLQLVLTPLIPQEFRDRAKFTLKQLQLQDGDWILQQRQYYYDAYKEGNMTILQLERDAPLLARALKKQQGLP
ncbi:hypothetical protein V2H45_04730 [Tumidithrix elongata RA019]|uniref:Uncharacterized protein n=1 Tax=Tumidithrix elongata BACA0141 TaxID=2716417 RepID=A0AAW9PUB6_9CYAN|nr:hypothetical protein [Tumidithrix elongata RA019]